LDQNAALASPPAASSIACLPKQVGCLAPSFGQPSRLAHQLAGTTLQDLVFSHADDVVDFREIQQRGPGKPAIQPPRMRALGKEIRSLSIIRSMWYLLARKSLSSDGNACGKAFSITTRALAPSFFTLVRALSGLGQAWVGLRRSSH